MIKYLKLSYRLLVYLTSFTVFFLKILKNQKKKNSENSENDQSKLTGHFQSCFFFKYLQTSKVNQQSILNLLIFHNFPKNLDRTITFNSVTLKNTQTKPQKYISFSNETNNN